MDSLTKKNTWNELAIQFPKASVEFLNWIDKFKEDIGWDYVFNPEFETRHISGHAETRQYEKLGVKFHQLPFDIQTGIIIAFFRDKELLSSKLFKAAQNINHFKLHLHDRFALLETFLTIDIS